MRSAIIFLAAIAYVYGETLNLFLYEELPVEYREFVPEHVRKFYITLTDVEKILIREFATKTGEFDKKSDVQAWALLETKNLALYERAYDVRVVIEKLIEDLKPETKVFVNWLFDKLRLVYLATDKVYLQETAKEIIGKYKDLKEEYKIDLKTHFIWIYDYIQNSRFEDLAKGIFV